MKTNIILSASGWRKIFAKSQNEQSNESEIGTENRTIAVLASKVFCEYVKEKTGAVHPSIVVGTDSRPTGKEIADAVIKTFVTLDVNVKFIGITAAPEIMAYSKNFDGFLYISASHNPIGHNGIKFGLNSGGVLEAQENAKLIQEFTKLIEDENAIQTANELLEWSDNLKVQEIYKKSSEIKNQALKAYKDFLKITITASENLKIQEKVFSIIKESLKSKKIGIVCDMNGSARCLSVDSDFFKENSINFYAINNQVSNIVHEIIPESENLIHVAKKMQNLQEEGVKDAILGYMPDCDGDRGNIVYWDENSKSSVILKAQEVFSLSVLAELSYSAWLNKDNPNYKAAVVVNCPTSMRIEEIAKKFNAKVFRAEVGEANVVNCANYWRNQGYDVRILGEGSNGGTITYPSCVRDPLNTIFAIIKLLTIKDLYKFWCNATASFYNENYTLNDILQTLPEYTTTGVSESRAILHISTKDHAILKSRFQNVFINEWEQKKDELYSKYNILFWECVITNGITETRKVQDFSLSKKGGLKIIFYSEEDKPIAFIWMRGSGTEPVFRIMCDVKGTNPQMEKDLLFWETQMLKAADK